MNETMIPDVSCRSCARILHHAARAPVFGLETIEALRRHGHTLGPGTLHPTVHGLQRAGFVQCEAQVGGGTQRKYDKATAKGRRTLAAVRGKLGERVGELLEDEPAVR